MLDGSSIHSCRRTAPANIVEIGIGETGMGATVSAGSPIYPGFGRPAVMRNEKSRTRLYTLRLFNRFTVENIGRIVVGVDDCFHIDIPFDAVLGDGRLRSANSPSACFLFPLLYVHALYKEPKAE